MFRRFLTLLLFGACNYACADDNVSLWPQRECTSAAGYQDAAFCTIPNEIPLGGFVPPPPGGSYDDYNFGRQSESAHRAWIHPSLLASIARSGAHNKYLVSRERAKREQPYSGCGHRGCRLLQCSVFGVGAILGPQ